MTLASVMTLVIVFKKKFASLQAYFENISHLFNYINLLIRRKKTVHISSLVEKYKLEIYHQEIDFLCLI